MAAKAGIQAEKGDLLKALDVGVKLVTDLDMQHTKRPYVEAQGFVEQGEKAILCGACRLTCLVQYSLDIWFGHGCRDEALK